MKNLSVLLLFVFCTSIGMSQYADKSYYLIDSLDLETLSPNDRKLLDSAMIQYHGAEHDTDRIYALDILSNQMMSDHWSTYNKMENDLLAQMIETTTDSSLRVLYLKYYAGTLNNVGVDLYYQGKSYEALKCYEKTYKIQEELGDELKMAWTQNNIAQMYEKWGNQAIALEYYYEILRVMEKYSDYEGIANTQVNIGTLHTQLGDIEKSHEFNMSALENYRKAKNKQGIARCLIHNMAYHFRSQNMELALKTYEEALSILTEIGDELLLAGLYQSRAGQEQDRASKRELYNEALTLSVKNKKVRMQAEIYLSLAVMDTLNNNFNAALKSASTSLELYQQLQSPKGTKRAADLCARIYRRQGYWKLAFEMKNLQYKMNDKVNRQEAQKAALKGQFQYEYDTKVERDSLGRVEEQRLADQEARAIMAETDRRNRLQYGGIFVFVLLLGALVAISGRVNVKPSVAEGLIFIFFILLFEFILVAMDPWVDEWSGGHVMIKMAINSAFALIVFAGHQFFEGRLKKVLIINHD